MNKIKTAYEVPCAICSKREFSLKDEKKDHFREWLRRNGWTKTKLHGWICEYCRDQGLHRQ